MHVDFAEYPSNITLPFGSEIQAVFRCRHSTADTIGWIVNGSSVGQNPSPDIIPSTITDDDGTLVHTLTIIARPEYNGTEVECVAVFFDGSPKEDTPSVTLTIIDGRLSMNCYKCPNRPMWWFTCVDKGRNDLRVHF